MRKLAPFDPKSTHVTTQSKAADWQSGESSGYRESMPPMDPDAKMRALHKLSGHTQVRRNPETGGREFLLHRGQNAVEKKKNETAGGTHYHYADKKSSWTPNFKVAQHFGNAYSKPGDPIGGHIASAWVPEEAIHMIPRQLGNVVSAGYKNQPGPNAYSHEHEVIVAPGHLLPKAHPVDVEKAKNESYGSIKTLQQRLQDKLGEHQAGETYVPSWLKKSAEFGKLAKMLALNKGAMRRLAPFNPEDKENERYAKDMHDWQHNGPHSSTRDEIVTAGGYTRPDQLPNERMRALHKLSKLTHVRRNGQGFREFLLHRGMSTAEANKAVGDHRVNHEDKASSWTPSHETAQSFAVDYRHNFDKPDTPLRNTVSAWVDERHIATMPNQVTKPSEFKHEHEVFVKPEHNSKLATPEEVKAQRGLYATPDYKINRRAAIKGMDAAGQSTAVPPGNQRELPPAGQPYVYQPKPKLAKADPIQRVRQAEGTEWGRESQPRRATYDFDKLDNHHVRRIAPGLYHHTGEKRNVVFHVLSRSAHPGVRNLASMAVGQTNHGDYLLDAHRAHGADKGKGYVDHLWQLVRDKHPEVKVARVDHESAQLPEWKDHHPDLYHDLIPDLPVRHLDSGIAGAQVVGKGGEPTALIKPAMTQKLIEHFNGQVPPQHQHFMHPSFTTSHREAMFHHLADHVFNLGRFVPKTTAFKHPITGEPFSAMEWLKQTRPFVEESQVHHLQNSGDIHKLAIMDFVLGNNDRHKRNVLLDRHGDMKLIDHGLAFDYGNMTGVTSDAFPAYARNMLDTGRVPQKVHAWVQTLNPDRLSETMKARGAPAEVAEIAGKRLKAVREWSAKNQRTDNIPSGKLGEAYGKAKAYALGRTPAEMDQEARVADQDTELADPNAPSGQTVVAPPRK